MYYGIISLSALLFSLVFIFSDRYTKRYGSGNDVALRFTAGSHFAGLIALLVINRFRFEFTPFTAAVAFAAGADNILFNICSLRALHRTNLSKYSVFSMIGGMALPFTAGLVFFKEEITAGKVICLLLVAVSLALTVERGGKKGGTLYYAGVFVTNGLYGVISKYFSNASFPKTSDAAYSVLIEVFTVALCLILIVFTKKRTAKLTGRAFFYMGGYGVMCAVGNYLLLIALAVLPASAQYPFVTGGVMIISTVYSFIFSEKPDSKQIASVLLALAGVIALVTL